MTGCLSVFALVASGLVLASSWFIEWPLAVFVAACLVGAIALTGVLVVSIRDSRREHVSVPRAIGRSLLDGLRFLRDFL
jgi:hypothetical protein